MSCLDLFPQLGHPFLAERGIDLPQMQMGMVTIPPTRELMDLEAVAVLCRLAAGATALTDEPLDQQGIAPDGCARLRGIKQSRDICERLCLVHAVENGWQRVCALICALAQKRPVA